MPLRKAEYGLCPRVSQPGFEFKRSADPPQISVVTPKSGSQRLMEKWKIDCANFCCNHFSRPGCQLLCLSADGVNRSAGDESLAFPLQHHLRNHSLEGATHERAAPTRLDKLFPRHVVEELQQVSVEKRVASFSRWANLPGRAGNLPAQVVERMKILLKTRQRPA